MPFVPCWKNDFMEKTKNKLRHIAVILDGNGRWAERHGTDRASGHLEGARRVVDFIRDIEELDIECATLYAFSTENWKRSKEEVGALMNLLCRFLDENLEIMIQNKIRLLTIGDIAGLPVECFERLKRVKNATANDFRRTLILALNYGGRQEIVRAARKLAEKAKSGRIAPDEISEQVFADELDTAGIPDPDLLIRTSGEQRLSNFLLWQLSYSEFYFTDVLWPDFDRAELDKAIDAYYGRNRRFGGR